MKRGLGISVLDAARERISYTFDHFESVYVSFSGGKDSTVMLHLVAEEARKRGRRFGLLFVDLEAQFALTIDHVRTCFDLYKDLTDPYWICLPIHLRNAVSVYDPFWICWQEGKNWVRDPPKDAWRDPFPFFLEGMEFEEFVPAFGEWFSDGEKTACFVGIRSDESLNRYRTISSEKKRKFDSKNFTSQVSDNVYNIYPLYDWRTEDIWIYHGKNKDKPYNKLYDYMWKAGLKISQMRICQPYGDDQRKGLWLFHLVEPNTWSRIVSRVNGANSGSLYAREWGNINGYRKINKPEGHTWESFAKLLLDSMPKKTAEHYKNKIWKFVEWWSQRGYENGIPDEADFEEEQQAKAPSWRRICKSLLRNDFWCKGLHFSQQKSDAYQKYLTFMENKRKEKDWI